MKALISNSGNPELDAAAAALHKLDMLGRYVRPYILGNSIWERGLQRTPLRSALMRRYKPELPPHFTSMAGVVPDWAAMAAERLRRQGLPLDSVEQRLLLAKNDAIDNRAALTLQTNGFDVVIANHGAAHGTLTAARRLGVKSFLNHPTVSFEYRRRVEEAEARKYPSLACTVAPDLSFDWSQIDEELSLADRVLVPSSFAARTLMEAGVPQGKLCIVPLGVQDLPVTSGEGTDIRKGPLRILYAGQLTLRKGLQYLLEAAHGKDWEIRVAGASSGNISEWQRLSPFTYLGYLTQPALRDEMRNADVFVFPSLMEGLGMVVLQAMAVGTAVVVSDRGPDQVVEDGTSGLVVAGSDAASLRRAIEQLEENPVQRRNMGERGRAAAHQLSWLEYGTRLSRELRKDLVGP